MALSASSLEPISTKPNPRGRPVSRSVTSFTSETVRPFWAKSSRICVSSAVKGRLPTYSLVPMLELLAPTNGTPFPGSGRQPDPSGQTQAPSAPPASAHHTFVSVREDADQNLDL